MTLNLHSANAPNEGLVLSDLENRIQAIKITLRSMEKCLQGRLSETQYVRNGLVPIHTLPTEILIKIFDKLLESYDLDQYYKRGVAKISLVCSRWNTVAQGTPQFWSEISSGHSVTTIERALKKSGDCSLKVHAVASYAWSNTGQRILELITPHASRWLSADLCLTSTTTFLESLTSFPAPRLVSLRLSAPRNSSLSTLRPISLFQGNAPQLKNASFRAIPIPWDSPILSGLESLELRELDISNSPTSVQILRILESCPALETLVLQKNITTDWEIPEDMDCVHLPRLMTLKLEMSAAQGDGLMELLDFQLTDATKIHLNYSIPSSQPHAPISFEKLTPLLMHYAGETGSVTIRLDQNRFYCASGTITLELEYVEKLYEIVRWFALAILDAQLSPDTEVTLRRSLRLDDPNVHVALDMLMYTTTLAVEKRSADLYPLMKYLARPRRGNPLHFWPLQNLEKLHLYGGRVQVSNIVEMVRSRYGQSEQAKRDQETMGLTDVPLPVHLTCLDVRELRAWNTAANDEVVGIMVDGKVKWEDVEYSDEDRGQYLRARNLRDIESAF